MNLNNTATKKEFASLCWGLSKVNGKWTYWWKLLEKDNRKNKIFRDKMKKLVDMLNENDTNLLNMDIENEIWDLL